MTKPKEASRKKYRDDARLKRHADAVMRALPQNGDYVQRDDIKVLGLTLTERAAAVNHLKDKGLVDGEKNRLALTSFGVETVQQNNSRALPRTIYGQGTYTTPQTHNIRAGGLDHLACASRGHRH